MSKPRRQKSPVTAKKQLGQHFLTDESIIRRIVQAIAPNPHAAFLEIGPGLGAITLPMLSECKRLTVIELDTRVIPLLRANAASIGTLEIIEADVLTVDFNTLLGDKPWHVFGNLPYNISTPILFALCPVQSIVDMVFMLQKEVVERMDAQTGEPAYGRLSVMLQQYFDVAYLFDVPATAFSPPPKVTSAMVSLKRLPQPRWQVNDNQVFSAVVKQAFSMRRKTLRNALKPIMDAETLAALGVDADLRAEKIDGAIFAKIANALTS